MLAPAGAPTRLKVGVLAGRSESFQPAVKVSVLPSSIDAVTGTPVSVGSLLTSRTCSVTGASVWSMPSLTRTIKLWSPGPWASLGVQVKTPVEGLIEALAGAFTREKVKPWAGTSASVALAVKLYGDSSLMVT